MSADSKLMETLLRVEHKLDLILKNVVINDESLTKMAAPGHSCPVCHQQVQYNVDIVDSVVIRKCGCSTGKIALDMGAFAPPATPARKTENDEREQEDGNDADRRQRRSGRR